MPKRLSEKEIESRERLKQIAAETRQVRAKTRLAKVKGRRSRKKISSAKAGLARARKFSNLSKAFGAAPGRASGGGAGRPKGSYKYRINGRPVSVFTWRKHQAEKKRQLAQFNAQRNQRLARRGFRPEQIQQLEQQRVVQQVQQGKPMMKNNIADEELEFRRHLARNTVSPRTQQILVALRRTQNKAKTDNVEHDRRTHERNLVGRSMNMMEAHKNLNPIKLDFTGVDANENILMAPSVFREDSQENILRTTRHNIMQTREAGNNLRFF